MKEYESKVALIDEIKRTSKLFIEEFNDIKEEDIHKIIDGLDRSPSHKKKQSKLMLCFYLY